ncbi:MAG: poly(3-hydroxybutyrate) depolymerase [Phycisphaerales bacterium]|nr:poly(3-hydroxybutyrate) depolymerase [Phycisphaerales bacterium]
MWLAVASAAATVPPRPARAAEPAVDPPTRPATLPVQPATRPVPLGPGNARRALTVDGRARSYLVHVPPAYDPAKPTSVVLAFHGALMNAAAMSAFSGLSTKADSAGFVVVYPNGTGLGEAALFFNASAAPTYPATRSATADAATSGSATTAPVAGPVAGIPAQPPDDVAFTAAVLDDLATVVNVDAKRVFATGMSNGGMMCHRLAAELSDRIAAVAPIGGTLALPAVHPRRAVPVLHFHGTADRIVPFDGPRGRTPATMQFRSVADTVAAWVAADGCRPAGVTTALPNAAPDDGTTVRQTVYSGGPDGVEVVLVTVENGGHTWPGQPPPVPWLGLSTKDVAANDLMWAFFERHPMR